MSQSEQNPATSGADLPASVEGASRRGIVGTLLMLAGLAAGYGMGLVHFVRYLIPRSSRSMREMFVGTLDSIPVGSSFVVKDLRGQSLSITRLKEDRENPAAGFKALSGICPHLGCKVYWQATEHRFFCPCHDGTFDHEGRATGGPPFAEGKDLVAYEVRVEKPGGWVYVMIPAEDGHGV